VVTVGILILPLALLWLGGSFYHHDYLWLFPEIGKMWFFQGARQSLFNAVMDSFHPEALHDIGKGLAIIVIFILTLVCIFLNIRFRR
jgi:hypothetical protein